MNGIQHPRVKAVYLAAALIMGTALGAGSAQALDFNDVRSLQQNQVSEPIIINMVNQSGPIVATSAQLDELRSLGASESLIRAITTTPGTATFQSSNVTTHVAPQAQSAASVYAAEPSYVYSDPSVDDSSVIYVAPDSDATHYYVPDSGVVVRNPPPPVIYQAHGYIEAPSYVYQGYPRYSSGPSWGFSIGFGGDRDRYRPNHYRPGRPGGHRPPSYHPGRPGGGHRPPPGGRPGGGPGGRPPRPRP